jgi:AbiV family abortive infection protein
MTAPQLLTQYRGPLTIEQVAVGMNAATANARRLAQDASALLASGRFPTAASLAALSIEESGKVVILRRFLTAGPDDIKGLWKEYRSHTKKNINWIVPQLVAQGARRLDDFRQIADDSSDHPQVLDATKQIGFYTDCFNKAHWSIPAEVINEELAKSLVTAAEVLSPERTVSVLELELWKKHMGPVWNKNSEWMKQALINWYTDMQAAGLAPAGVNSMDTFVREGLTITQADQLHSESEQSRIP